MKNVNSILKKLFLVAIVFYVVGSCLIQADLCRRLGEVEHLLDHLNVVEHH